MVTRIEGLVATGRGVKIGHFTILRANNSKRRVYTDRACSGLHASATIPGIETAFQTGCQYDALRADIGFKTVYQHKKLPNEGQLL